ncbi:hypothetical protein D3C80_1914460 [compost metagenome]
MDLGSLNECGVQGAGAAYLGNRERAVLAMKGIVQLLVLLRLDEVRQHLVI